MGLRPAEPSLFSVGPDGAPIIHGRHCRSCGHKFFPAQDYGCERCGARPDELEAIGLATTGAVLATTTVNFGPGVTNGTVIGTIVLDDGPAIQVIFGSSTAPGEHRLEPATRVRAVLVPQDSKDVADLRFEAADSGVPPTDGLRPSSPITAGPQPHRGA